VLREEKELNLEKRAVYADSRRSEKFIALYIFALFGVHRLIEMLAG
jgi:hypothetical protein